MTYRIKLVSPAHVIALMIILLALLILLVSLTPQPFLKQWSTLETIGFMALSLFLWKKSVTGKTLWTITDQGLRMEWSKRFLFDHNSKGFFLKWNEINAFKNKFDGQYRTIKIELTSGEVIRFSHSNGAADDFGKFCDAIEKATERKSAA